MSKPNLRPLDVLARDIKAELKEIAKIYQARDKLDDAEMARKRTIGAALVEAKAQLSHGKFTQWVKNNFPGLSLRQYQRHMRRVKEEQKRPGVVFDSIKDCERQNKKKRQPKAEPGKPIDTEPVESIEPDEVMAEPISAPVDDAPEPVQASVAAAIADPIPSPESEPEKAPALALVSGPWWEQDASAIADTMLSQIPSDEKLWKICGLLHDGLKRRQAQKAA